MNGILLIDKEKGYTSHDVVAKLKGILGQKKIGHTGTLDPDATGVLPVLVGKATKLSDMLTAENKVYDAVLCLGITTDTQDCGGTVLKERTVNASDDDIKAAIISFEGSYEQLPPMYSAIKVNGKKLYELARKGVTVERKPRRVSIEKIEIKDITPPFATIRVYCSKGTYIRTLCHDIGEKLGCGAAMKELRRIESGDFSVEDAVSISKVQDLADVKKADSLIIPIEKALSGLPVFTVKKAYNKALINGNELDISWGEGNTENESVLVFSEEGALVGIYAKNKKGKLSPRKMLL